MARISFASNATGLQVGRSADISAATAAVAAAEVDVAAAVAVLVADGASPTQAHVTTLDAAHTILAAAIVANSASQSGAVVVSIDNSVVTTRNQLRAALRALLLLADGDGSLTG